MWLFRFFYVRRALALGLPMRIVLAGRRILGNVSSGRISTSLCSCCRRVVSGMKSRAAPKRCLFGTDFPVLGYTIDHYITILERHSFYIEEIPKEHMAQFSWGNAAKILNWNFRPEKRETGGE